MSKLKDCPFCGSDDVQVYKDAEYETLHNLKTRLTHIDTVYGFLVMCGYCCNRTMLWYRKSQAIKAWNKRATTSTGVNQNPGKGKGEKEK